VARDELGKRSGEKIVSKENYICAPEIKKKIDGKKNDVL